MYEVLSSLSAMAGRAPARSQFIVTLPIFLAPAFASCRTTAFNAPVRGFSGSCRNEKSQKKGRDMNRQRGVSAIRSTGPRRRTSVYKDFPELPTPRPEKERPLEDFPTSKDHGLYGFFNEKRATILPGEDEEAHGRPWTYNELMSKSFDDLHAIYWTGLKEMNRIATRRLEHDRLKAGFGFLENEERMAAVKKTNETIRRVLRDRQYLYEEARLLVLNTRLEDVIGSDEILEDSDTNALEDESVQASDKLRSAASQ